MGSSPLRQDEHGRTLQSRAIVLFCMTMTPVIMVIGLLSYLLFTQANEAAATALNRQVDRVVSRLEANRGMDK